MDWVATLLSLILNIFVGGIGALGAMALAALTKVGDRIIGQKFDERIEAYKKKLESEIEELKARLSHITDRGVRSNELEYEAITMAWEKFIAAHVMTQQAVGRFFEHPDLDRMSEEELENFLSVTDYSEIQKKEFRSSKEKNKFLIRTETAGWIHRAEKAIFEGREVLRNKGIFIPKDLEAMFEAGLNLCAKGWSIQKTEFYYGRWDGSGKELINYMEAAPKMVEALKDAVRVRILAAYTEKRD